ncbi:mechanosensitive ion channel family protein [Neptunicoccus cionae]|uniref:Small-conductance mechanosensitive channel n=1 Tax=Neptunicoccus cionae TaxID=2035344 RepID=A0A916R2B6_9RHOB|nr:mechanosensitive ion channel family protein [Amylibacter cionae]GGA22617.1 mechanosensitive ion channel protein MscS [Amylibacter cionae]
MRNVLLLPFLIAMIFAAPATSQTAESDQPAGQIAVEDNAATDAAIATRIRDILEELDVYSKVTVSVSNGIVLLRGTTLDAASVLAVEELVSRVEGVVAVENRVIESTDLIERLDPLMERFSDRMQRSIAYLPLLLVALAAFVIVAALGILLARMKQPWDRLAPNMFIADIYRQIIRLVFVIAGLVVALDILNATALLSTILGAAGIIGLAIGFAVRDTVENFIASIMLSIRQPFRPNDSIEINGDEGMVIRLTSRATILLSFDGNHIRIPNSTVFKSRIVNYSRNAERRFVIDFGVAGDTDLTQARQIALTALKNLPFVIDAPAPGVWVEGLGDSTITLRCAGWVNQQDSSLVLARGEAIEVIKTALEDAGVEMPEPTYRLVSQYAGGSAPAPETPSVGKSKPATGKTPEQVDLKDVSADEALDDIVNEERDARQDNDLLTRQAPEE